jgi:hypothetical protein
LKTCGSLYDGSCRDCDEDLLNKLGNYKNCGGYVEVTIPLTIPPDKKEDRYNGSPDLTRHLTPE